MTGKRHMSRKLLRVFFPMGILIITVLLLTGSASGNLIGNPGVNVGKKNLVVGFEYSYMSRELETMTYSNRYLLKATTGLSDWFDIYLTGGAADLKMNYYQNSSMGSTLYDYSSNASVGAGFGVRIQLMNFENRNTRVFIMGDVFGFRTNGEFIEDMGGGQQNVLQRETLWIDGRFALGITFGFEILELSFGAGAAGVQRRIDDVKITRTTLTSSEVLLARTEPFDYPKAAFGFIGLDFVLPLEYRLSFQIEGHNLEEGRISFAISQGLEKD